MDILVRYAHFLGILILCSTLVAELLLLKPNLTREEILRLSRVDAIFGFGALIVLSAGLLLWFHGAKPAAFYARNPVFLAKISLFGTAALLSIYPTVYFLKNRKGPDRQIVAVPRSLRLLLTLELALILLIPLLAVLMARGVGLPG